MVKGAFSGLICFDITYYQDEFPQENLKSKTTKYKTYIGGPAANAAITYSLLGGNATLITCLGNSIVAKAIKNELIEDYGVNLIDLVEDLDVLPNVASILVNQRNATRTIWSGQQQFTIDQATNYEEWIKDVDFCFSDCNLPEVTVHFLQTAKKLGKTIVLDPGSWKPHFPDCLQLADEVIASVNCNPENESLLSFLQKTNVKNIAITDGENATKWFEQSIKGEIEVPKVKAVDTLAAGDVLHGAYCYYRFNKGLSFVESLEKATTVATETVKYLGPREGVYKFVQ